MLNYTKVGGNKQLEINSKHRHITEIDAVTRAKMSSRLFQHTLYSGLTISSTITPVGNKIYLYWLHCL